VNDRLVPYPDEAQNYLAEKYGIRRYSARHLSLLVNQGRFPKPIEITPRRKALTISQLDQFGESVLAKFPSP
jgi:hypothetical protein